MLRSSALVASAAIAGALVGLLISSSRLRHALALAGQPHPDRLILVRHGESEGNLDQLLFGHVPDNAMRLTPLGLAQAAAAGRTIKQLIGTESVRFIVSPYVRTIETFQGILKALQAEDRLIQWTEEPRIREQDFGNFQEPVKIREYKEQRERFGWFFYRFPSGESPADVYDRMSSFLESLHRMFGKHRERNYVLVTHGVTIRVLLMRYFKMRVREFERLANLRNGEVVVLEFDRKQGKFVLSKTVSNCVSIQDDGSVTVQTEEATTLRVWEPADPVAHHEAPASQSLLASPTMPPIDSSAPHDLLHARSFELGR